MFCVATKHSICQGNNCKLSVFENGKLNDISRFKKFGVTGSCILTGIIWFVL